MITVLLTGFEPFAGDAVNPSGDAVRAVAERWDGAERLITAVLPVTFEEAPARLRALMDEHRPDVVVAVGLAGGRAAVSIERIAVNLVDARIPDNAGAQPIDEPVVGDGPAAHFATLPVKAIVREVAASGVPAELSHTAGTFVCNQVFYTAVHEAPEGTRAGFVHVPWSREAAPSPDAAALPLADIVDAVERVVRVTVNTPVDATAPGGAIH